MKHHLTGLHTPVRSAPTSTESLSKPEHADKQDADLSAPASRSCGHLSQNTVKVWRSELPKTFPCRLVDHSLLFTENLAFHLEQLESWIAIRRGTAQQLAQPKPVPPAPPGLPSFPTQKQLFKLNHLRLPIINW